MESEILGFGHCDEVNNIYSIKAFEDGTDVIGSPLFPILQLQERGLVKKLLLLKVENIIWVSPRLVIGRAFFHSKAS